jgi:hypothetical protein
MLDVGTKEPLFGTTPGTLTLKVWTRFDSLLVDCGRGHLVSLR